MPDEFVTRPRIDGASVKDYTIAELATRYGISYRTLRFYEQKGLVRPARNGTQRIYDEQDCARLGVILLAKRLGFSLTETRELIRSRSFDAAEAGDAPASVASLGLSKAQIGARVERLVRERENVQHAIDELRSAVSAIEGLA